MEWKEKVFEALVEGDCFISSFHKMRFTELFNWVCDREFFDKGLCKCLFLSSCDQEHTNLMTRTLEEMIRTGAKDTSYMARFSQVHIPTLKGNEKVLFELSQAFIQNPDETPDETCLLQLSRSWIPIGDSTLQASLIIDSL